MTTRHFQGQAGDDLHLQNKIVVFCSAETRQQASRQAARTHAFTAGMSPWSASTACIANSVTATSPCISRKSCNLQCPKSLVKRIQRSQHDREVNIALRVQTPCHGLKLCCWTLREGIVKVLRFRPLFVHRCHRWQVATSPHCIARTPWQNSGWPAGIEVQGLKHPQGEMCPKTTWQNCTKLMECTAKSATPKSPRPANSQSGNLLSST